MNPYFFETVSAQKNLRTLFYEVSQHFNHQISVPVIQFEPGKSISEMAGACLCRILAIRETVNDRKAIGKIIFRTTLAHIAIHFSNSFLFSFGRLHWRYLESALTSLVLLGYRSKQ